LAYLSIEQENAAADMAFAVLKMQPGWMSVQERISEANARFLSESKEPTGLQEHRDKVLGGRGPASRSGLDAADHTASVVSAESPSRHAESNARV
jgi:hypothetical protein